MRSNWRSLIAVAASGLAVAAFATVPAAAAPAPAVGVHDLAPGAVTWTPEAMRAAVPLDRLLPGADASKLTQDVRTGAPQVVAPTNPVRGDLRPMAFPEDGGPWTGGGAVESTAGRVFFTYAGRSASCSGNAVTSDNRSVVMTAGHCVKLDGAWHTDWVFVPAYDNGNAPYGQWAARATFATPQWTATEDINYDVGAAVVVR